MNDQVTLVDAHGNPIGAADKLVAHQNPPQLHAAVSVWLFNARGETLLQQRSSQKIVGAGWWGNAICGNVRPEESALECAQRRLREEIGVTGVELQQLYSFEYQAFCNDQYSEHEWDTVFGGKFEGEAVPNPDEAAQVAWVDFEALKTAVKNQAAGYLTANETLQHSLAELKELIPPFEIEVDGQTYLLTPWTILMVMDGRLSKLNG